MLCAVSGCNNYNNKHKKLNKGHVAYHVFPKDPKLLKKWIKFCKQPDDFDPTNKRICSDHFTEDDFEKNFQFELGISDKKRIRLKPGSLPSLVNKPRRKDNLSKRSVRAKIKENKRIVRELLGEGSNQKDLEEDESEEEDEVEVEVDCMETIYLPTAERFCEKCEDFKTQIEKLRLDKKTTENELKNRIQSLKLELQQNKTQKTNIEERLSAVFTRGQIDMLGLKETNKPVRWTEVDITTSLNLYTTSVKGYNFLRAKGFPLPGVRTLQRWAQRYPEKYANCRKKAMTVNVDEEDSKVCEFSIEELEIERMFSLMDEETKSESDF